MHDSVNTEMIFQSHDLHFFALPNIHSKSIMSTTCTFVSVSVPPPPETLVDIKWHLNNLEKSLNMIRLSH